MVDADFSSVLMLLSCKLCCSCRLPLAVKCLNLIGCVSNVEAPVVVKTGRWKCLPSIIKEACIFVNRDLTIC